MRRTAFTLIELLVAITIIVALLAMIAPALDQAVNSAMLTRCLTNQHATTQGLTLYLMDHRRTYPVIDIWWGLMGEKTSYNTEDVTTRPLNRYMGYSSDGSRVPVAQCPSDQGDEDMLVPNIFRHVGTSYLPAYSPDPNYYPSAVKSVFGHSGNYPDPVWGQFFRNPIAPARHSQLEPPYTKVVSADWPWHGNRSTKNEQTRWHRPENQERLIVTLFADSHAELFNWDKEYVDPEHGGLETRPWDQGWKWW